MSLRLVGGDAAIRVTERTGRFWLRCPAATQIYHEVGTAEVNAITSYPQVPGIVLAKTPGTWPGAPIPDVDERWSAAEQLLAEQTGAVRIDAVSAGHYLQRDIPDLVTLTIQAAVDAVRYGSDVTLDRDAVTAAGGSIDGPRPRP